MNKKEKFMSLLKEASLTTSRRQGKNLISLKKKFLTVRIDLLAIYFFPFFTPFRSHHH
jgi:hypothetical protein